MNNSNNILNELKELSPLLAVIEKINVFTVPEGYFEMLEEQILMNVKEETGGFLSTIANQSFRQVPQGYFESLADNILNKIKAQDDAVTELKVLSPMLHSITNKNVFTVPQGYFESLAGNVLNKITEQDNAATELKELSPILYSIQNENVFTVPQGYFQSLSATILGKTKPQQAKVIAMSSRRTTTILKYAVAAVFTGLMALGVFKFAGIEDKLEAPINYSNVMKTNVDAELAKISDAEILSFLNKEGVDVEAAVAVAQMQDKFDAEAINSNDKKAESNEIDELLNQLDDKQMN
ncbi:hypothetical protein [Ferruginibacter sp.]|nr:hypothetical protein [Ferruginibacter sp.]